MNAVGLMNALQELVDSTKQTHKVECVCECQAPVPIEENRVATQLYRIAQEAIANSLRHSQASRIRVLLETLDDMIALAVHDNGVGLPVEPRHTQGVGLKIMRFRAESVGGMLEIQSGEKTAALPSSSLRAEKAGCPGTRGNRVTELLGS